VVDGVWIELELVWLDESMGLDTAWLTGCGHLVGCEGPLFFLYLRFDG
jgi:hypothetical protein